MTLFAAWAGTAFAADGELTGPWEAIHRVAPDLLLVDSPATLSRVYHELKWSLPEHTPLFVAEVAAAKSSFVAPGTLRWLRERGG